MYIAIARTKLRDHAAADKITGRSGHRSQSLSRSEENNQGMFVSLSSWVTTSAERSPGLCRTPATTRRMWSVLTARWASLDPTGPLVAPFPAAVFRNADCQLNPETY